MSYPSFTILVYCVFKIAVFNGINIKATAPHLLYFDFLTPSVNK